MLTIMAKGPRPQRPARLYIGEHQEKQGVDDDTLAERLGCSTTSIWRYKNMEQPNGRVPDANVIRAIEEALQLEPGELYRPPTEVSDRTLLRGLNQTNKEDIIDLAASRRKRQKAQESD